MKLEVVKIADSGPRTFICEQCETRVTQSPATPVFADRHGTPFASYYCEHCADAMYFDDERAEREAIQTAEEFPMCRHNHLAEDCALCAMEDEVYGSETFDDTFSRPT